MVLEDPTRRQQSFLGNADENILHALARYHCLTLQQLLRILGHSSRPALSARLSELVERGYLNAAPFRLTFGSPHMYTLTDKAAKYLAAIDITTHSIPPSQLRAQLESSSMPHTVAVNDALIAIEQLVRVDPSFSLHILLHDYHFKKQPFVVAKRKVIPDGWVEVHKREVDGITRYVFALEVQHRGHITTDAIREKVRNYMALMKQGVHHAYFNTPNLPLVVLFLTTRGTQQVQFIKQAIEAEIRTNAHWATIFYVAPFTKEIVQQTIVYTQPVWHQPFQAQEKHLFEWMERL